MSTNQVRFSEDEQTVLRILRDNIRGRSEARENKLYLPEMAVRNATPESLSAVIDIHNTLAGLVPPGNYRTRHTGRTSTGGYGISYQTLPVGDGPKAPGIEIQGVLLPTRDAWGGFLEVYFRGHRQAPVEGAADTGETKAGLPVFRVTQRPSPGYANGVINAFRNSILFPDIRGIYGGLA